MSRNDAVPSYISKITEECISWINTVLSILHIAAYCDLFSSPEVRNNRSVAFDVALIIAVVYAFVISLFILYLIYDLYSMKPRNYRELSLFKEEIILNHKIRFVELSLQCLFICLIVRLHHSYICIAVKYMLWVCDWCYYLRCSAYYERKFKERYERWGNRTKERVRNMKRCHSLDPTSIEPWSKTRFEDEPETLEEENERLHGQVTSLEEEVRLLKDTLKSKEMDQHFIFFV